MISALCLDVITDGDLHFPLCTESSLDEAATAWQAKEGMVWVEVVDPQPGEMEQLAEAFDLHDLVIKDAIRPRPRPELDDYGDFMTLALYVPRIAEEDDRDQPAPDAVPPFEMHRGGLAPLDYVYLIFRDRLLVTVQRQPIPLLRQIDITVHNDAAALVKGMGGLVHYVIDEIVDAYFQLLDTLSERVEATQEFAFLGPGKVNAPEEMKALYGIKRDLLALRRVMAPQEEAMRILARSGIPFYTEPTEVYFQDVFDHAVKVQQTLQVYVDLLTSARESFLTRVSNDLAIASRALLVVTMFFSVPAIVFTLYGTNFDLIPEAHLPIGHAWALLLAVVADLALFYYGRRHGVI